jgi:hypothetical protein
MSSNKPCRPFLAIQLNSCVADTVTQFAKETAKSRLLLVARGRPIPLFNYSKIFKNDVRIKSGIRGTLSTKGSY